MKTVTKASTSANTCIETYQNLSIKEKKKVLFYFQELLEDLTDRAVIEERKNEPRRPFRAFWEELQQKQNNGKAKG